jgi:hypothetical protein
MDASSPLADAASQQDESSPRLDAALPDGTSREAAAPSLDATVEASFEPGLDGQAVGAAGDETDGEGMASADSEANPFDGANGDAYSAPETDGVGVAEGGGEGDTEGIGVEGGADAGSVMTYGFCGSCGSGYANCGGVCIPTTEPTSGCGSCTPCALPNADATCSAGACAILRCHDGWSDVDGDAADGCEVNYTSPSSCFDAGVCTGATPLCSPAGCVGSCPVGLSLCGESCLNLDSSSDNCGTCGFSCARGLTCELGSCVPPASCDAPEVACGGINVTCATPVPSAANCVNCDLGCAPGDETGTTPFLCSTTACIQECPPGWTQCPDTQAEGAAEYIVCVVTQTDVNNCGACGNVCIGQVCINGACVPPGTEYIESGLLYPSNIALDATNIFWTDGSLTLDDGGSSGRIATASKMGGPIQTVVPIQTPINTLVLDDTFIYWTNGVPSAEGTGTIPGGTIMRAPKDGSTPAEMIAAAANPGPLVVVGPTVYFVDGNDGIIQSVPKTGGTPTLFAQVPMYSYFTLVTDGTSLYSTRFITGSLDASGGLPVRISISTGQETIFPAVVDGYGPIAVDATRAYYFNTSSGGVEWFDLADGGARFSQILYRYTHIAYQIVPADCGFYFSDGDLAYFATLQPLVLPAAIAQSQYSDGLGSIAVDETSLYWTDPAEGLAGTEATRGFIGKVPRP